MLHLTGRGIVSVAMLALATCTLNVACSTRECAGALQFSSVSISVPPHLLPAAGAVVVHVCAAEDCRHDAFNLAVPGHSPTHGITGVGVEMSPLPHDADIEVSVRMTVGSRTILSATTLAHTVKPDLYDPECGFDHWQIHLTAHRGGRLT